MTTLISPEKIISHGSVMRRKVERLRQTYGTGHPAIGEVFALADDICELVIALAENQKQWLGDQQAQHEEPK